MTWDVLDWLREQTSLPLWIKGVLRGDDAKRAVDGGIAGIIVSNHGGRQLDTAIAGIDALPDVVAAVNGQCEILMDGGVRRGVDVVKAIALGANGVLLGRPPLWGLAVNGEKGVSAVLEMVQNEFENALALCGCPTVADIDRSLVV
jgi:isopentenyl diphosphate isomerase/L-lactate dehydrogenase-like FMN-dependent dehydrogenase